MATDEATARCDDGKAARRPPSPIDIVRALLSEGRSEDVLAFVAKLVAENSALSRQLQELSRKRYKTSETVSSSQLRLLLTELAEVEAQAERDEALSKADEELRTTAELDEATLARPKNDKPREHKRPARRPFPEKLRRVDNPIPVAPEERPCPKCGEERTCIGHEVTEVLELVPAELVVRRDKREKLACLACDGELCRAPLGDKVIEKGRMGVKLVSCMTVEKYRDGLPLHRQIERFRRLGVSIPVSTLVDQVKHVAEAAKVLQEVAIEEVLASHVMHLDGTGMPVLDKKHRNGTRLGNLWGYVGDGEVAAFLYASTGKKTGQQPGEVGPEDFLKRRKGLVVADASNLFDVSFKRDDLIECGCNAHGRRGFVRALDGKDSRAALPVGAYRRLYAIEREGRELSAEDRTKLRQEKSKPVFDALLKWCQAYAPYEPPSSPLGEAIRYFTNHHVALGRFIEDGAIPIDNSIVERQHVRVALTRKNFLFCGSDAGGHRAAVIYTVLGCCALADVDPVEYLSDVLPRLARGVSRDEARELLPHRWKAARAAA
jgi:transposase